MVFTFVVDWLHLLTRWFHLVAGAAWIGASFYFVWLNNNVRPLPDDTARHAGGLWAVHGGAFYLVRKFKGAPEELPSALHWFKWEAYLTWLSGVLLLGFVYWLHPAVMMVKPSSPLSPAWANAVGIAALPVGWLVYDLLCRSPFVHRSRLFAALGYLLIGGAAVGLHTVLSPRAAFVHLGAMLGTLMAWNVFFVIIPGQRAMVDAMSRGEPPPVQRGRAGALRSLHNNYFTLPVLFIMVSNHFPFTYGHPVGWVVLMVLGGLGAVVKHWMNLHERGQRAPWVLPAVAVGLLALAFVSHGPSSRAPAATGVPTLAQVKTVMLKRCISCHAAKPTQPGILEAPKGFRLDVPERWPEQSALIYQQAVLTEAMPLGNLTGMTREERALLGAWIDAGSPLD
ncbi:MAG: urate hydroxylase PuuD [Myxococcota bacterium]